MQADLLTTVLSCVDSFLCLSSASAFCMSPYSSSVIVGADREGRNTDDTLSSRLYVQYVQRDKLK